MLKPNHALDAIRAQLDDIEKAPGAMQDLHITLSAFEWHVIAAAIDPADKPPLTPIAQAIFNEARLRLYRQLDAAYAARNREQSASSHLN